MSRMPEVSSLGLSRPVPHRRVHPDLSRAQSARGWQVLAFLALVVLASAWLEPARAGQISWSVGVAQPGWTVGVTSSHGVYPPIHALPPRVVYSPPVIVIRSDDERRPYWHHPPRHRHVPHWQGDPRGFGRPHGMGHPHGRDPYRYDADRYDPYHGRGHRHHRYDGG